MSAKSGFVALALFVASIPLANWTLHRYGFRDVWLLGPVASGVVWVGLAFVARDVVQLTLGKRVTLAGIAAGFTAKRYLEGLLYGVDSRDWMILAGPAIVLFTAMVLAAVLPAVRAVQLDPIRTLRSD